MDDLFGGPPAQPPTAPRRGAQPWPGCDTSGEAWRRYCEAWSHAFVRGGRAVSPIMDFRGVEAAMILEHDIEVVRVDYAGGYPERADLQQKMEWRPSADEVERRTRFEKSKRAGRGR